MTMLDPVQKPSAQTDWLDAFDLTQRQRLFVLTYLEDMNATQAARRVGYLHPNTQGPRLLVNVRVAAAVEFALKSLEEKLMIRAEDVRRYWWMIATADVRDLVGVIRTCCRYCYGQDHEYQWRSKREFREARIAAILRRFPKAREMNCADFEKFDHPRLPSDAGGFGYRATSAPCPDCPECEGLGTPTVQLADTRDLPAKAALLYNGVRQGANGPVIQMQSRSAAMYHLAKSMGMFQ